MNIRPVQEADIESIIQLFRANYGDDYFLPEFYDPQWVKRGIYSDHIIWLVAEEDGQVLGSAALMLNAGDYNDQIGEIGRLVVNPNTGGRGLGGELMNALVDASDDRVEFSFAEARTVHPKTQKICDRLGLVPLGYLPLYYQMSWRESWILSGQLFGNGRTLRHPGSARVIPSVAPLARLSLKNLALNESVTEVADAAPYPTDGSFQTSPLTGESLVRIIRIEHGRLVEPEIFSAMHVDLGYSQLRAKKAEYLVVNEGEHTLGAVGFLHDERNKSVRITELIGEDEAVKGTLLRLATETAEHQLGAELIKLDVNAASPRLQQTVYNLGFLPAGYIPGMVFHQTHRPDVIKMIKLTVPYEPGPLVFTESGQEYHDLVAPLYTAANPAR